MAQSRKDNKGRVLRKGETQRKHDGKYVYTNDASKSDTQIKDWIVNTFSDKFF